MPFARPSSSPSGGTSQPSALPGSSLDPAKLATPWDAQSLEKQLEMMKQEAAASSASSMYSSPSRPSAISLPRSQASPNINGIAATPQDMASPDSQAMSSSSSASPPEQYFTSHRALKQRLFQMSDDDEEASSTVANSAHADPHPSSHGRYRVDRSNPVRQSISALSGVTIIGRGSIGSKRDSQGSISTIGSQRNSIEESRPGAMYRTQSDNVTAPLTTLAKRQSHQQAQAEVTGNPVDMPSALHLLQMYPRAASPPRNFDDDREVQPMRSRSVSPHSVSPRTQKSVPLPGSTEGGSRPVRRHSRSSMASELLMSPVTGNLSMTAPTSASEQGLASSTPSPFDAFVFGNQLERTTEPSPSAASATPVGPALIPETTSSRNLASTSADGDSPRSRRTISSSRSVSTNDLAHIMRTFSSRSRKATGRRRSTQGQPLDEAGPSTFMPTSTSADPVRRSTRGSRQPSISALKDLIRQKRRMASAPFRTSASVNTSGTTSPIMASGAQSPVLAVPPEPSAGEGSALRRARSRRGSAASTGLSLNFTSNGFEEARMRALRGMGDVVMTPSVEEWKLLGLDESLNERNGSESSGSESDTSSSESSNAVGEDSDDVPSRLHKAKKNSDSTTVESTYRPRMGSITAFNQYYGSAPPPLREPSPETAVRRLSNRDGVGSAPVLSRSSSKTLGLNSNGTKKKKRPSRDFRDEADTSSAIDDESGTDSEVIRTSQKDGALPTLSRQSLSMPTGTHIPGLDAIRQADGTASDSPQGPTSTRNFNNGTIHASLPASPVPAFSPSRASSPIPLTLGGPADPRAYSAVTGLRDINSFVIQGEAGKGAYGLVRRVREKGADGRPTGPNLMLKYIVKQRILADAYKRHKVLGVIPMEIHVLDFIRRIYRGPGHPSRDPISQLKRLHGIPPPTAPATAEQAANQTLYGHPNLCQMLDFFEDAENYYLVMSCFGNGQDLFDYVDAAPMGLSIIESQSFLTQIVDAVAFLHSHGVVHRDIKDENIILDGKGGVQLIDFGSAAYIKEGKPYFDTFSGTLDFASPEVLRGERYGGKETDIWALGVLAYVIFCGECPFWSSEESLAGLHTGCRSEAALQAKADSPEIQAELHASSSDIDPHDAVDFVHQCLQVHARERPPAVHLRRHRFISGKSGWTGTRGWEALDGYSSAASGFDSA